ncbi:nicotinate-nucleotide adenylyltransferase [Pseudoalteromonas tunicata]|jgi:nicotinate-nucleotide adenylyltransferase|uniref:Probable nicotinate-nucleotide adenylyltransferase n=1 Tax=Pseudoalteromonas tunicata D2 TaxID=87626 RepID=A4CDE3_9GAMM|nr:nicotinate-nucleotide adenylyltransferase [Pseudoalteromonas tunicata]ATC94091.1 nicotinate-nucleotide adenylyltransferase [Pseudoalteromonas tunicata]AXT29872.1 nicotinate-nucleotide adenylyltransferase [Pseudoalteromonas tunicata]EAR27586.1 nicotinic acid mononucleotide adenylyltransferase, NAD(P)-requiring [Pseudoalteromonas tunicata D2]
MIGIFGGTFDPIHQGHLNIARQCCEQLNLTSLAFMPCAQPAHKKSPGISARDRANMVQLAIAPYPKFSLDERELNRVGPSYSLLSLQEIRQTEPNRPIAFLIGMDSLNQLHLWHRWQEVTALCHLIVCQRPGQICAPAAEVTDYLKQARCQEVNDLVQQKAGLCYFLSCPQIDISSSELRLSLKNAANFPALLPKTVANYIKTHQLYC